VLHYTSRGIAVLEVNYRGSVGYGRAYRRAIYGQWGVADVDDCVAGAEHAVRLGLADSGRLGIRGASAGGFTALCALFRTRTFAAGSSVYGVTDPLRLAARMHKFESRYFDQLIGPRHLREPWHERAPIAHIDDIGAPLLVTQGVDDPIVPVEQAVLLVESLRSSGMSVEYLPLAGEGHGFRRLESWRTYFERELRFFARVFRITLDSPAP
jgi:dipeptidyl aminopeptidase/acylaminoacyl peptidase